MSFGKTKHSMRWRPLGTSLLPILLAVTCNVGFHAWLAPGGLASPGADASQRTLDGEFAGDWDVGYAGLAALASRWLETHRGQPKWRSTIDLDRSGTIDLADYVILARKWKKRPGRNLAVVHTNDYPTRLALGPQGRIYVTDAKRNAAFIYNADLELTAELKGLDRPLGVAVAASGRTYVGNNGRHNVEVYSPRGARVGVIGTGTIKMPNDLALDERGRLYVADSLSDTVWVFDSNGTLLQAIGDGGQLHFPVAITIAYHSDGNNQTEEIYVADQKQGMIHVFDLQGNLLRSYGGKVSYGMMGWKWKGRFVRIQSLAVDPLGRVHAADCYMNNIQILDAATGGYIDSYGAFGTGEGQLNLPLDILISSNNEVIVANAENHRVDVVLVLP